MSQQDTQISGEDLPASAKVWNTTELLEQIISHLPAAAIVLVSGTNRMSYNCVKGSSLAQSKLFLRPSDREQEVWWYCERRKRLGTGPHRAKSRWCFEPYPAKNVLSKRSLAVNLCPLLQLVDVKETTAITRMRRQGWQEDETTRLVGAPAESTKYSNMFLTDPPTALVVAELTYKHTLQSSLLIRAKHTVHADSVRGLTFNDVVRDVRKQRGVVFVHEPPTASNDYKACHYPKHERSITEEMVQKVREHGGTFVLDTEKSFVVFPHRIVVPSTGEWLRMEAKRVHDKEHSAGS
jgi:hypothetical protein